jgi:hypothetical protein
MAMKETFKIVAKTYDFTGEKRGETFFYSYSMTSIEKCNYQ